jgi:hypothetical protein
VRITIFPDVRATSIESYDTTWADLAARCVNPPVYPSKQHCPLVKLAAFGDQRTVKGSFRHDPNVLAVSGLEGDYDAGLIQPSVAAMLLEMAGIQALVYTSPSHTPAAPRWRVLAPLATEHTPTERRELLGRLNGALGGILAHESFTLSQTYYVGRVAGVEYEAHQSNGAPIDTLAYLPAIYPASSIATDRPHAEREATPETIEELRSALTAIPAEDYFEWISVGQALVELGDEGFELWDEWSSKSDKYDAEAVQWKWSTFSGDRTGFAAVFAKAQSAGWENPKRRPPVDLTQVFGSAEVVPVNGTGVADTQSKRILDPADQIEFFKGFTYITDAHQVMTPHGKRWNPSQMKARLGGKTFVMGMDNSRMTRDAWEAFSENPVVAFPKVDHMSFRPDKAPGAVWSEEGATYVNTYRELHITRTAGGDASPFLNHLRLLFPDERDYCIALYYLCGLVQYQGKKFQWALFIQGMTGNGKTLLSLCASYAVGAIYSHVASPSELVGTYNSWLEDKVLIIVEDIYEVDHIDVPERMKPMITNVLQPIRAMRQAERMSRICANFLINSNHKDSIRKTLDDRRWAMLYCAQQSVEDLARDGMDKEYFARIYGWLNNGGFAIVADLLATTPIPDEYGLASLMSRAPETSCTTEALHAGLSKAEQEIQEAIESGMPGFQGGWVSSKALDVLMMERRMSLPRNKRRGALRALGYGHHPNLQNGRSSVDMPGTTDRPTLYIKNGHWAVGLKTGEEIMKAYISAQVRGAKPAVGLMAVG